MVTGTLMDKAANAPLKDAEGKPIKVSTSFTATGGNESQTIEFKFDGSKLGGKDLVVFESLSERATPDTVIAKHENLEDKGQTVTVTKRTVTLSTTAAFSNDQKTVKPAANLTINDKIMMRGLDKGAKYTVKGVLMDKSTGKELKDKNGKAITGETPFTANDENQDVIVSFKLDGSKLAGKSIVIFETLYAEDGSVIVEDKDLNSVEETVAIEKEKTPSVKPNDKKPATPETGDMTPIGYFTGIALLAGAALMLTRRRSEN